MILSGFWQARAQTFQPQKLIQLADSLSTPDSKGKIRSRSFQPLFYQQANLDGAEAVGNTQLWSGGIAGLALSGNGVTIGYWDQNQPRLTHQEYSGRVTFEDSEAGSNDAHATQMVGTMVATGGVNSAHGMANQAQVNTWNWNNDLSEIASQAATGLLLSEHPYTNTAGWTSSSTCGSGWTWYSLPSINSGKAYQFGYYDNQAELWDSVAYLAPNYLIVKAAGNQRGVGPNSQPVKHWTFDESYACIKDSTSTREINGGTSGFETLTSASVSKNVLVVGAVESSSNNFDDLSSITPTSNSGFGPTDDGRIKPDLVTPTGLYTSDSDSDTDYATGGGTSAASAVVAGSIALIREHYQNLFSDTLSSASIRGLLAHTADDIGETGPDYKTGWGLLNTERAVRFLSSYNNDASESLLKDTVLTDGSSINLNYTHSSTQPLIVTIAWTDPPGTTPSDGDDPTNAMLVNNLNLQVTDPESGSHYPWILNPNAPSNAATNGTNTVDNIEQVFIERPESGTYQVSITHAGTLTGGSQRVSVFISSGEPTVSVESIADGSWTNTSTWKNGVVPATSFHNAVLKHAVTLNTDQTVHGISLTGSSSSLILNHHKLTIEQTFHSIGSDGFIGDSLASVYINGWNSTSDSLRFSSNGQSLGTLSINAPADSIKLSEMLSVFDSLKLASGMLDATSATLTLKSDSTKSALYLNNGGSLLGNLSYSRQFSSQNSGWRMIASPLSEASYSDLNSSFFTQGGSWATNQASDPDGSLWLFDENTQNFSGYYGADTTFTPGKGYLFYMFAEDVNGNTILPANMVFKGTEPDSIIIDLNRGSHDSLSYALVGNPFAGTIDWDLLVQNSDSIGTSYAVWNASGNTAGGSSGYEYYNSVDQIGDAGRYIAPLQGFFVYATGSSSIVRFRQSQKTGITPKLYGKRTNSDSRSIISFRLLTSNGDLLDDQARLIFSDHGSRQKDPSDVYRLPSINGIDNSISFSGFDNRPLVFEGRSNTVSRDTVNLTLNVTSANSFSLRWEISPHTPEEWNIDLYDRLNDQLFDMRDLEQVSLSNDLTQLHNKSRFSIIIERNTQANSETGDQPIQFALHQNYPNPFNPSTVISYQLAESSHVRLTVFDMLGRQVGILADEFKQAGIHTVNFNAHQLSSGIYFYRLEAGNGSFIQTRKMLLMR